MKRMAEKLRLSVRQALHSSSDTDMHALWQVTSDKHRLTDSLILTFPSQSSARESLNRSHTEQDMTHINTLVIQGALINTITNELHKSEISRWSNRIAKMSESLFKFARKAL